MNNPRLAAQTFYGLLVLATGLVSGYLFRQSTLALWLSLLTFATVLCFATLADTLNPATITVGLTTLGLVSLYLLTGFAAMPTFGEAAVSAAHWTEPLPQPLDDAPDPEKAALVWAHDTLHDARINPATQPLQAIKAIRAAAPRLRLSEAVELVEALTKRAA